MPQKRTDPYYQAQDILSRRDHSEFEVRQKLKRKGFDGKAVSEVVQWLKEKKLLNDAVFAGRYVESIVRSKLVGSRWIQNKLREKRIGQTDIETALRHHLTDDQEQELCRQAAESWMRRKSSVGDKAKLFRFLSSRGFSMKAIQSVSGSEAFDD